MGRRRKTFILVLVTLFLIVAFLIPSITNAETTSSYGSYSSGVFYTLTMYSPNNQTVYANTMLLHFTINWEYYLLPIGNTTLREDYAYSIDNDPLVSIAANTNNFYASFSNLVHVSNLTNGYHNIAIIALMYLVFSNQGKTLLFNESSSPTPFLVQNPPNITVFSPQNQSYEVANPLLSSIPLNFTVDQSTSWMGYSLDNQNNITITGNFTLTGLTYGLHTLAIYANDTYHNTGSRTINFTVTKPESFPTVTVAVVSVAVAAVVVAAGLLVYHKKRKY